MAEPALADSPVDTGAEAPPPAWAPPITAHFTADVPWEEPAPDENPDQASAPEEPASEATPPTPDPDAPAAPLNLADLSDEQIEELAKVNPRAKSYLDRRVANEYGNRLEAERRKAREAAVREYEETNEKFALAEARWEEIEDLRLSDPEEYERVISDTDVARWRASFMDWRYRRGEEIRAIRQPAAPVSVDPAEFSQQFNGTAIQEFQAAAAALVPGYSELPVSTRDKLAQLRYDPNGNWFVDGLQTLIDGINEKHKRALKDAVETARKAGQNELLANEESDRPLPTGTPIKPFDSWDVIARHSRGENVNQSDLQRAYKERGYV